MATHKRNPWTPQKISSLKGQKSQFVKVCANIFNALFVCSQFFKVKYYFRNSKNIRLGRCDMRFQLICNTIILVPCDPITVTELYDNLTPQKISFNTTNHPRGLCPRRLYTFFLTDAWRYVFIENMMDLYHLVLRKGSNFIQHCIVQVVMLNAE